MLIVIGEQGLHKARGFATCVHNSSVDAGGNSYMQHIAATVNGVAHLESEVMTIIATLHDVLEKAENASNWAAIFKKQFNENVIDTLFHVWRRPEEPYSWSIERVILGGWRSMAVKLSELHNNLDVSRYRRVLTAEEVVQQAKYTEAYAKLHRVWHEKYIIPFGQATAMELMNIPALAQEHDRSN